LFHRAIIQSGSFDSVSLAEAEGDGGELLNPAREIAEKLNAATAEALRAISVERLLSAYTHDGGFIDVPRVIEDGVALPASPLRDAFASVETFNKVPVITGTNHDEMKLLFFGNDELTKRILGFFIVPRDQESFDTLSHYISRVWRIRSVDEPAAMMTAAGHEAVYAYRFDWDDGGRLLFMDFKKLLGAAHGFEIPFVFNRFQNFGAADWILFRKKTLDDRERLSSAMGGYWASFARDGVPSYAGAPAWPVYGENGASFMRLDTDNDGGIEVINGADSLDALVADLKKDPRIDDAERCLIVEEMAEWMFTRPIQKELQEAIACSP
jgi:para-nitrobenzyl esterase